MMEYTSVNCFRLSLTSESPAMDDCWPERWANRIPRKPQASRKKTTRKSDRRELRAILRFPSLRACFHPSYHADYTVYHQLILPRTEIITIGNHPEEGLVDEMRRQAD